MTVIALWQYLDIKDFDSEIGKEKERSLWSQLKDKKWWRKKQKRKGKELW